MGVGGTRGHQGPGTGIMYTRAEDGFPLSPSSDEGKAAATVFWRRRVVIETASANQLPPRLKNQPPAAPKGVPPSVCRRDAINPY